MGLVLARAQEYYMLLGIELKLLFTLPLKCRLAVHLAIECNFHSKSSKSSFQ